MAAFPFKATIKHYKWTCDKKIFAQLTDKSRTVLTKATAFVIAEKFSRGKETREQYYYYERIALLIPIDKRQGQSPACESWSSMKCKALFV